MVKRHVLVFRNSGLFEDQAFVQDKSLQKVLRKGFHENYYIPYIKPYKPDYIIAKCIASSSVFLSSQFSLSSYLCYYNGFRRSVLPS
jgi:hypothetical protein